VLRHRFDGVIRHCRATLGPNWGAKPDSPLSGLDSRTPSDARETRGRGFVFRCYKDVISKEAIASNALMKKGFATPRARIVFSITGLKGTNFNLSSDAQSNYRGELVTCVRTHRLITPGLTARCKSRVLGRLDIEYTRLSDFGTGSTDVANTRITKRQ
jgi:hypothetical protein